MADDESKWRLAPLDELTDEATPITYGVVKPGDEGDVAFVRGGDISGGRVLVDQLRTIRREVSQQYRRTLLRGGEILVSLVGNPGQVAIAPRELAGANIARQVGLIRLKPGTDTRFVSYFLQSHGGQAAFGAQSLGSVQQVINLRDLKTLKVPLPPLAEQQRIAHILGTLDDKIDLNRRMNATLEAMARAIYESWFVDFDPVRRNADGRESRPEDSLFSDSFVESDQGAIPSGWSFKRVQHVVEGVFDGPHATPKESDSGAVFLGIKNLTGTGIDLSDIRHIDESDWPRWTKRVTPAPDDIVFSYEATLGFFALIPPNLRCCLGRRLALIRPYREHGYPRFWFHQFVSEPFQRFLDQHSIHGATVNRIPLIDFPKYPVLNPPDEVKALFERAVGPIWARIHENQSESHTLASLRDALLPMLLSGDLSAVGFAGHREEANV